MNHFLLSENEKENQALGDVDPSAVEEDNFEFMFSMEDIKKKYMDFLGLEPSDFESHAEEPDENHIGDNEGEIKNQNFNPTQDHVVNKEELIDELKKLDISNQEETAYIDINYWKPIIEYDVDHLLAEIDQ